jgi:hypothetical protein
MVVIVDLTNGLFTNSVSQSIEPVYYSTLTNCTKAEMYGLLFGITEVDELPDIDYYRASFGVSSLNEILIDKIKNLNPSIIIYNVYRNNDNKFTGYYAELSSIPAKLHIRLLGKTEEIATNIIETVCWIELNDKKIIINEELSDETIRKILFTRMIKFYQYLHAGPKCHKDINNECLMYLKQKIIKNAMLEYLQQKNNRKQEILDQIAELQKELNGL